MQAILKEEALIVNRMSNEEPPSGLITKITKLQTKKKLKLRHNQIQENQNEKKNTTLKKMF